MISKKVNVKSRVNVYILNTSIYIDLWAFSKYSYCRDIVIQKRWVYPSSYNHHQVTMADVASLVFSMNSLVES